MADNQGNTNNTINTRPGTVQRFPQERLPKMLGSAQLVYIFVGDLEDMADSVIHLPKIYVRGAK